MRQVPVAVSVDTEEDQWEPSRDPTVANARQLPRLADFFANHVVRPTWFVAWSVATDDWARGWLREEHAAERGEVAAHLHPWNTPPVREELTDVNTMLKNLPPPLVREKLARLTDAVSEVRGTPPTGFRAGRFGLAPHVVGALVDAGYRTDSSVVPNVSWEEYGDGPTYVGAPMDVYRMSPDHAVMSRVPGGPLVQVPASAGFTRPGQELWRLAQRAAYRLGVGKSRWTGLAWRLRVVRRVMLSPEPYDTADILRAACCLVRSGVGHLHFFLHSQSASVGLSPFVPDQAALDSLYRRMAAIFDGLHRFCTPRFSTVAEIAADLG